MRMFLILAVVVVVGFIFMKKSSTIENSTLLKGTYLIEGVKLTNKERIQIKQYYTSSNSLPESNSDIGGGRPESYKGESLVGMKITYGGVVTLTFNEKSGVEGGKIVFKPKINGSNFEWICTTSDYKFISEYIPECKFE